MCCFDTSLLLAYISCWPNSWVAMIWNVQARFTRQHYIHATYCVLKMQPFHKVMQIYHRSKNGICIASTWRWLNLYTYIILNFSYGMISWNKYQAYAQTMMNVSYKGQVYREANCQICLHVHLCLIWYLFIKYQQQWSGKERTVVT